MLSVIVIGLLTVVVGNYLKGRWQMQFTVAIPKWAYPLIGVIPGEAIIAVVAGCLAVLAALTPIANVKTLAGFFGAIALGAFASVVGSFAGKVGWNRSVAVMVERSSNPIVIALRAFISEAATASEANVEEVFGRFEQVPPFALVREGLLTEAQSRTLARVIRGEAAPTTLYALLPDGALAITPEQEASIAKILSDAQLGAFGEVSEICRRRRDWKKP